MLAITHMPAGALSAIGLGVLLNAPTEQLILLAGGGVVGAMLPDIDHPKSAFGRRILPVSTIISALFGHRGITHSLLAVILVAALSWLAFRHLSWHPGYSVPVVLGISAGYLSHLLGDWMTNSGIPFLWPIKRRFVSPIRLFTGGPSEYLLCFGMYAWIAWYLYFVVLKVLLAA